MKTEGLNKKSCILPKAPWRKGVIKNIAIILKILWAVLGLFKDFIQYEVGLYLGSAVR